MKPILLVEIITACVAFVCMVALAIMCVWMFLRRKGPLKNAPRWHAPVAAVMCVASAVHGMAAMAYASGANLAAYVIGWLAVAAFCASGACAMRAGRRRLGARAITWHVGLFVLALTLVIAHARVAHL